MECSGFFLFKLVICSCFINHGIQDNIIFSTYGSIQELNLTTGNVSILFTNLQSFIHCFSYEYSTEYIYFPRDNKNDILRFLYPSKQAYKYETVTIADTPVGVVVDSFNKQIYWTERWTGTLYRCDFDGLNKEIVIQENALVALALDLLNGWVFYTIPGTNKRIRRSRLNGTDIQTLVNVTSGYLYGMAVDLNKNRVYWMETGYLKSCNYDGNDVSTVINTNTYSASIGMHVYGNTTYVATGNNVIRIIVSQTISSTVIYSESSGIRIDGVLFYSYTLNI